MTVTVHAKHHVLKGQLVELFPDNGERVRIRYLGERAKKNGDGRLHVYKAECPSRPKRINRAKYARELGIELDDAVSNVPIDDGPPKSDIPTDDDIPF